MDEDIFKALFGDDILSKYGGGADIFWDCPQNPNTCVNCLGNEWDVDEVRGDLVCIGCGACSGGLMVGILGGDGGDDENCEREATYAEDARSVAFDTIGIASVKSTNHRKDLYKRKTYLRDKLSQWLQTEKPVPKEHFRIIEHEWRKYLNERGVPAVLPTKAALRRSRGQLIPGCHPLEKRDIRRILRACDAVIAAEQNDGLAMCGDDPMWNEMRDEMSEKTQFFVRKYLEKWLSLRWRFTGQHSTAALCPANIFGDLQEYFVKLEEAFGRCIRPDERKAFPNYNEMIRNILQLLFLEHLGADFPGLSTKRARNKNNHFWWIFCKYHKWPYLLKEAKFLRNKRRRIK